MFFLTLLVAGALHCAGTNDSRCPLFGDVDGDGHADAVRVERRRTCGFDLIVRTRTLQLSAALPEPFCHGKPSEFWQSGFPRVLALRPMNRTRGLEPEVLMWSGASNDGIGFFTFLGGQMQPMRI